jgi:hypothetical protein
MIETQAQLSSRVVQISALTKCPIYLDVGPAIVKAAMSFEARGVLLACWHVTSLKAAVCSRFNHSLFVYVPCMLSSASFADTVVNVSTCEFNALPNQIGNLMCI